MSLQTKRDGPADWCCVQNDWLIRPLSWPLSLWPKSPLQMHVPWMQETAHNLTGICRRWIWLHSKVILLHSRQRLLTECICEVTSISSRMSSLSGTSPCNCLYPGWNHYGQFWLKLQHNFVPLKSHYGTIVSS